MGLIDRLRTIQSRNAVMPPWPPGQDNLWPFANIGGNIYQLNLNQTLTGSDEESAAYGGGAVQSYMTNSIVFACMAKRMKLFSEARARYQRLQKGKPGDLWGDASLDILEHPWPGAATGDLLARAIQDADWAGNFYATRRAGVIYRMRPDWVNLIIGGGDGIEATLLGLAYYPGGEYSGSDPVFLQRQEFVHFAPYPDPTARFRGMSWLTPVIREVAADNATTNHKLAFFRNGATPNMIVKRQEPLSGQSFKDWVTSMRDQSEGSQNAYKTFYLSAGADATVVGKDFQQIELRSTQGAGEVRIIAASGLHPVIVGVSESLQGSSLNSGNFGAARRLTADTFLRPDWRNFFSSMETLVPPPAGSRLWYDDKDIPFLREDSKDAAEIQQIKGSTIRQLVDAGYEPESVVKAVNAENMDLLVHSGLYSVQLQPPMPNGPPPATDMTPADTMPADMTPAPGGKTA
jgi:hypothetical protein